MKPFRKWKGGIDEGGVAGGIDGDKVGSQWNGSVSGAYGGASSIIALQRSFGVVDGFQTNMPVYLMGGAGQSSTTTTLSSAGTAMFADPVSGSGGLTIDGDTVALLAANTYTGGTTVINATAAIGSDAAFGDPSGGLSLNGGTLSALAPLGHPASPASLRPS